MLQNGKLPRIFNEGFSAELLSPSPSKPFVYLKKGMNALGLIEVIYSHIFSQIILPPSKKDSLYITLHMYATHGKRCALLYM